MEEKEINIEVGQTYNYFDDGKITTSRKATVIINSIIAFEDIDEETYSEWKIETEECDWLYSKETDFFVKGTIDLGTYNGKPNKEDVVFVRTINDGWFSLGWWAGRLDVDGSLNAKLEEYLKNREE